MNPAFEPNWRTPYLAQAWDAALAAARKKADKDVRRAVLPTCAEFREQADAVWAGFINQSVYEFWHGIHGLCTRWDGDPDTEDDAFDARGQPTTFYDEAFIARLCELAAEYGLYESARQARVYVSLYDRYCERGRWVLETLQAMLLELPALPSDLVDAYWRYRIGLPAGHAPDSPQLVLPLDT